MVYRPKKFIVCGGRDFDDLRLAWTVLHDATEIRGGNVLVVGDCPTGADQIASEWAAMKGLPVLRYPADWDQHGRAAGPMRNQAMLETENPAFVVALPGGRGTASMVRLANLAGVLVINYAEPE